MPLSRRTKNTPTTTALRSLGKKERRSSPLVLRKARPDEGPLPLDELLPRLRHRFTDALQSLVQGIGRGRIDFRGILTVGPGR